MNHLQRNIALLLAVLATLSLSGQDISDEILSPLKFRYIGPVGNRVISAAGIPGNDQVYYIGSATGGLWKTTDSGHTWKGLTDDLPIHAIGSVAVSDSDPETVYMGTGEAFIRSNISMGDGVYKSTDGGDTWTHIGLEHSGRVSRIVIDPRDPDIVYVAALGHGYSPQKERGVYKTTDGGKTWKQVLYVDDNTGASDIVMDPSNPNILLAGMWQLEIKTWVRESGGPSSGIYMSKDAGETWTQVKKGLPKLMGKSSLAMTPANPNRIYALIETGDGVPYKGEPTETGDLWRSDDKGKSWKLINKDRSLGGRQSYYTRCAAAPDNENEVYFIAAGYVKSIDGGKSAQSLKASPNWDHHDMWIDPTNGDRQVVVGDGGLSITNNRGRSWQRVQLPVAQLYHVTTDNDVPYNVLTNRQDGPSMKGPSRTTSGRDIQGALWHPVGGGESGFATPDPEDHNIVWSSASGVGPGGGIVTRYDERTGHVRHLEVWPEKPTGHTADGLKYRFQWTFPLLISPHDRNTVYVTSQHVHRTTNGGQTWEDISPDLTLNDKSLQSIYSGGLTGENVNIEYINVIYALEESPLEPGVLWAGTNDGLVHISRDNGANWENVTKNIPNLPEYGVVRKIEASKYKLGKAYMTIEFHQVGDFDPYVYKTEDYGKSWKKITNGIKDEILSYTRCILEDPVREGLLYLGTENKLYVSMDDGANWQVMMNNLPSSPMYWIDVQEDFNDLVIGTYGRGIHILDNISALQQLTPAVEKEDFHLFDQHHTYRLRPTTGIVQFFSEPHWGKNPKYGAPIDFWLKEKSDSVNIQIMDPSGKMVREIKGKGRKGINRKYWNLRTDPTEQMYLRTPPPYAEWMGPGKDGKRKTLVRPLSLLVPPGDYTVKVSANGKTMTKILSVKKDPNSEGTMSDINTQYALMQNIHSDMDQIAGVVNNLELMRSQLQDLSSALKVADKDKTAIGEVDKLEKKMLELEEKFYQLKITGNGQDFARFPTMLAEKYSYLAGTIESSDFRPADSQQDVYDVLKNRLGEHMNEYRTLVDGDVPAFQKMMTAKGLPGIIMK